MQIFLGAHEINDILKIPFPEHHDALFFETWKVWAQVARLKCEEMLASAKAKVHGTGHIPVAWVKAFTHLRNLARRLAILSTAQPNNWVVDELPKGYLFDPIQPGRYAESALLLGVPDVVIMSATLRPKTLYMTGISKVLFDFKEFPSDFDPKRCPIYYIPTMRVDSRSGDWSMLWIRHDQIAGARQDRNGLVHTVSFANRDQALTRSRFRDHMFINERGEPATHMVEEFKQHYPGAILVSPSVGQGFDFTGKAAEWQLICKIPFPPPSKVLKARTERDREHPYYLAMAKFVQMTGRIMRDKADQGESFICDDHFAWFMPRYRHLAPGWFNAFVREVSVLPQPPQRLA
jgi:Rad3-related DNA helicase